MARNSGAKIIEGCCGTMPEHLEKMRTALETYTPDQATSLQKIEKMLGAFSSTDVGTCLSSQVQKRVPRHRRATSGR